jgi:hypothetical protein
MSRLVKHPGPLERISTVEQQTAFSAQAPGQAKRRCSFFPSPLTQPFQFNPDPRASSRLAD